MSMSQFGHGSGFGEWSRHVNNMLDEMLKRDYVEFRGSDSFQPATNVYEASEHYYICVELAGIEVEQIDVRCVEGCRILITGTRASPRPADFDGELSIHAMEIDNGSFRREIDLPEPVADDAIHAEIRKGFLWIIVPRIQRT